VALMWFRVINRAWGNRAIGHGVEVWLFPCPTALCPIAAFVMLKCRSDRAQRCTVSYFRICRGYSLLRYLSKSCLIFRKESFAAVDSRYTLRERLLTTFYLCVVPLTHRSFMRLLVLLSVALLITACDRGSTVAPDQNGPRFTVQQAFLPYGVPIPQDTIHAAPEPYQPSKHGAAYRRDNQPENLAGKVRINRRPPRFVTGEEPMPGDGDAGLRILYGTWGIYVRNDVNRNMNLPRPPVGTRYTIYAPTHLPAGRSCIETVTIHWRRNDHETTADYHGFWNHCVPGEQGWGEFQYIGDMDNASWRSNYVRINDGEETYWTQVNASNPQAPNGCWDGYLV
jgi:hypothetical protein